MACPAMGCPRITNYQVPPFLIILKQSFTFGYPWITVFNTGTALLTLYPTAPYPCMPYCCRPSQALFVGLLHPQTASSAGLVERAVVAS